MENGDNIVKLKLYNFKAWNWIDKGQDNRYMRAAVFASNEVLTKLEIRNWLKRDHYELFEVIP